MKADATNFAERERLLVEAREALRKEFEAAGAKVLEGAQEAFLRRAADRFEQSEKTSAERLRTLLAPVGERLQKYEQQVQELEAKRSILRAAVGPDPVDARWAGGRARRSRAAGQFAAQRAQGARALGRTAIAQPARTVRACRTHRFRHRTFDRHRGWPPPPDAIVRIPGQKA
jgi:DNA recombination protein RmuC